MPNKITLLAILILTSCGGDDRPSPGNPSSKIVETIQPKDYVPGSFTREEVQAYILSQNLSCGETQCPEAIAKVTTISNGHSIANCSSFLIADDIIATNRHCLPDELEGQKNKSCRGKMYFTFDRNKKGSGVDSHKFTVDCDQILDSSSKESNNHPSPMDYAFLKLSRKVNREPFKVSTSGVDDQSILTVWKINHGEYTSSTIYKDQCRSVANSGASNYTGKLSKEILLGQLGAYNHLGCKIIPGNSGSVITNSDGEAVGIISRTIDEDGQIDIANALNIPEVYNLAFGESFACIDNAIIPGAPCDQEQEPDLSDSFETKALQDIQRANKQSMTHNGLQWSFDYLNNDEDENEDEDDKEFYLRAQPKCFNPDHLELESGEMVSFPASLQFNMTFDPYLRLTYHIKQIERRELVFDYQYIGENHQMKLTLQDNITDSKESYFQYSGSLISECLEEE